MADGLNPEQMRNAVLIAAIGFQMGMAPRDIKTALITAMQESSLTNLTGGDSDSAGLFQQRPSQGWGTYSQVTNPTYATKTFYHHLGLVGDRTNMSMTQAAQAVQRSAHPDAYGKWVGLISNLWPQIAKQAGQQPVTMDGQPYDTGLPDTNAMLAPAGEPSLSLSTVESKMLQPDVPNILGSFLEPGTGRDDTLMSSLSEANPDHLAELMNVFAPGAHNWRKAVVEDAMRQVGTPYVWGGDSPEKGFDCSGLLQYVFGQAGISIPRVSYSQAGIGEHVGIDQLRPGDLVAFQENGRSGGFDHIALYIGNNEIIEAPHTGLSVRVRSLGNDEGAYGVHLDFGSRK